MTITTLITLARPKSSTDRRRSTLLVAAVAVAGVFLLAGQRIMGLGSVDGAAYSTYLTEDGLRPGVVTAVVLLAAAACALALQALRLGTAARDRRLAALRLGGATPSQVRLIGAAEAGLSGLLGGVLAGPVYFALAAVLQSLPQVGRVLPAPALGDLVAWPVLAVVLALVASGAGGLLRRQLSTEPRSEPDRAGWQARYVTIGAVGTALVVLSLMSFGFVRIFAQAAGVLLAASGFAPVAVAAYGRRLERSGDPVRMLAGGRLLHTARSVGRMLALLVICGGVVGAVLAIGRDYQLSDRELTAHGDFIYTGLGFVALLSLFAALAAGVAMLAGAADDLLDQRSQLAALNVFGMGAAQVLRSVRIQLTGPAAVAVGAGVLIGGGLVCSFQSRVDPTADTSSVVVFVLIAAAVVGVLAGALAALATGVLGGQVRDAVDPANLRTT
ncbi:FtsX-like permease family protein [Kribbella pittospori]|uniref:FtsX-like permease family protein n=1 Tax=Kribbella pittospori TaxID=722689 RepID=A0A4R0KJP2_9ACTN|nr:FtsX-like permease family protein [Kribbella pittospori]TCC59364.1 FtsX-like permease family protein [Kribbella pittospori]